MQMRLPDGELLKRGASFYLRRLPRFHIRKSSAIKTTAQQVTATLNKSKPRIATMMPMQHAAAPAIGLLVAFTIAGKVITASVTYGT